MNITYIASSGNVYPLEATRIRIKDANFHSWNFKAESTELVHGSRIAMFRKQSTTYEVLLIIRGTPVARAAILNALHDDFENDLRKLKAGRIVWGDWYCDCYIVTSDTNPHPDVEQFTENKINIMIPSGFWMREETREFSAVTPTPTGYLDYPYNYEYDYTPTESTAVIWETESPFASDFVMSIYGPCVNPRVTINGYPYVVNASIPNGETLVIDSKKHTVMMGDTNLFDSRGKEYSVFEKIPAGALDVAWDGFDFSITLLEERSEPKW